MRAPGTSSALDAPTVACCACRLGGPAHMGPGADPTVTASRIASPADTGADATAGATSQMTAASSLLIAIA